MKKSRRKVILLIMDGWGIAPPDKFNAIENAKTPNFDRLVRLYPNTSLKTDGESVGLSEGQFGTSEINHLTIGSGRIIWQELPKINNSIKNGEFFKNEALLKTVRHVEKSNSTLHLTGIVSDGGVHSHIDHLIAIFELLNKLNFRQKVNIHVFSDGRDVPPRSVERYLIKLDKAIKSSKLNASISTIQGRFYLDRDRDWEKTEKAVQLLLNGVGHRMSDWQSVVNFEYNRGVNDEFFEQYILDEKSKLNAGDGLICFHYRTDRQFQLIKRILHESIKDFEITSFVKASEEFGSLNIAFPRADVKNTLAEVISSTGLKQFHVTETEKFPHLTYFLNGQRENELPGETWKMFESNRFVKPMYQLEPTMKNYKIVQEMISVIANDKYDFIVSNLSSPDMVGHTGDYNAAVVSAQSVDYCLGELCKALENRLDEYALLITADHGNSEIMWDYKNKQPHTQHTLSKVPFILVCNMKVKLDRAESLIDIAPTILEILGVEKPIEMEGKSLLVN